MILEHALLTVDPHKHQEFEADFSEASQIISSMKGYIDHSLNKCLEKNQYLILVKWKTLEDHTIGFRQSAEYQEWKKLLHHYYDPFPEVLHFEQVM